ncbi:MAG: Omp28 family outer membrane lipoprotein [Bacteroidales bacterium]|jgi:hypothetical protein|nr:Omp28 family outer membrane lipoprotein [Bacteroidales bacterium]
MKKILVLSIIFIACIASCDKIDKPYRVSENVISCDTPSFATLDDNAVIQKYLLEDYTGHKCPNCPRAQVISARMKTQMGDTLVLIAIHSGTLARPENTTGYCSYSANYNTEVGNEYTEKFLISTYPSGLINRRSFNGSQILSDSHWETTLNAIVRETPTIGVQIMTENNGGEACVFVKTTLLSDMSNTLRLNVLLIEDGIISAQKYGTRDSCEYVHNHVLRTSFAPVVGDNLTVSQRNDSQIKGYSLKLNDTWKKENCHIIAFISDANTDEILQVEEAKLIE